MSQATINSAGTDVRVRYEDLVTFVTDVLVGQGMRPDHGRSAAEALCYGDLTGLSSHGVANLTRLYLPLFDAGRVDPVAEPEIVTDRGAAVLVDAHRSLGLWAASELMDLAIRRASVHGVGLVSVRNATHFGCAGYHAGRAARRRMVGLIASNCGGQRIARPPGGRKALLGTNPFSVAAPGGSHPPYILDMSTTVVPTGRIRAAARAGESVPEGWLEDDAGRPVTDPGAFDRDEAGLLWLGGRPETGAFKGYGLGLLVEVLAALVSGSAMGPEPEALLADSGRSGTDDDIGFMAIAIAPDTLRPAEDVDRQATTLFGTLLGCPPVRDGGEVSYPGRREAERAGENRRLGVPLPESIHRELNELADTHRLSAPHPIGSTT
jgi:LDH2 family malate/lactate/ureidoglycolate dehydrogenase